MKEISLTQEGRDKRKEGKRHHRAFPSQLSAMQCGKERQEREEIREKERAEENGKITGLHWIVWSKDSLGAGVSILTRDFWPCRIRAPSISRSEYPTPSTNHPLLPLTSIHPSSFGPNIHRPYTSLPAGEGTMIQQNVRVKQSVILHRMPTDSYI